MYTGASASSKDRRRMIFTLFNEQKKRHVKNNWREAAPNVPSTTWFFWDFSVRGWSLWQKKKKINGDVQSIVFY